jgi:hypothetical protein
VRVYGGIALLGHATPPLRISHTTARRTCCAHAHKHYDRAYQQHDGVVCLFAVRLHSTSLFCSICATAQRLCCSHAHQHCDHAFQQHDCTVCVFAAGMYFSTTQPRLIAESAPLHSTSAARTHTNTRFSAARPRGVPLRGEIALNLALLQHLHYCTAHIRLTCPLAAAAPLHSASAARTHTNTRFSAARSRGVSLCGEIALNFASS